MEMQDWKEILKKETRTLKVKSAVEIPKDFSGIVEHVDGNVEFYLEGKRKQLAKEEMELLVWLHTT